MNFKASSKFTPVDISRVMQRIVPPMVSAVTEGCAAVVDEAQMIAPVDKGDLVASIHTQSVAVEGTMVTGVVVADSDHAMFVEFGTGVRGEGTYPYPLPDTGVPITGSWIYDYKAQNWQGHAAQPYMRPALDTAQPAIKAAFASRGFKV